MMMKKVLLIEDEPGLQMSIEDNLKAAGYAVTICGDGITGESTAFMEEWDLMLLDIMLPGKDGFEICRSVRKKGIKNPIIMLTARSLVMDKVMGLNIGADDYISKPFDIDELIARINAVFRRGRYTESGISNGNISFGKFILNTETATLITGKENIHLNTREYLLLKFFAENRNRVVHRNELLDQVWGYDSVATTRTVDVHVAWLRKKLGEQKENHHITTVRGLGYRFSE
ncbi:MAG: response regulator transcription factor [Spirochaetales bacterium]|nr:response regulator transcription factor [Spirochaetales bacterium]